MNRARRHVVRIRSVVARHHEVLRRSGQEPGTPEPPMRSTRKLRAAEDSKRSAANRRRWAP